MKITASHLKRLATGAKAVVVDAIVETAPTVLPKYGITTPRRLQHFFSQLAHESGGFKQYEENLNYSAKRLTQVWPKRFPTLSYALPYANNPPKLANKVYGGRMGNRAGSNDGYDYRGRGLIQITGRDGYRKVGLEDDPDQAAVPENFLDVAGRFWKWKNLNALADSNDINEVTRRINGGLNGLADRKEYLAKARRIFTENLSADEEVEPVEEVEEDADSSKPDMSDPADLKPAGVPATLISQQPSVISTEMRGDPELWSIQKRLHGMNYSPGGLDGVWGGMTAGAITAFINDRSLEISAPTSLAMFKDIREELKAALSAAETEQYKRPIAIERASATGVEIAPKLSSVRETIWSRFLAKVQAVWLAIVGAFWAAMEWLTSNEHTGPVIDAIGRVPRWAWVGTALLIGGTIAGLIWKSQRKAEQAVVDQFREGRLQA